MNETKISHCNTKNGFKILIASNRPVMFHKLVQLINHESDVIVCDEAENTAHVLDTIERQQFDLVIVDIPSNITCDSKIIENIKLREPNAAVLVLSMDDELLYANCAFQPETGRYVINQEANEQITRAICDIKSLLKSRIFGFTVFVKVERGLVYAHEKTK